MDDAPQWQRTEPDRFRFCFWDDELTANVFDLSSGETHALSTLALELLNLLDAGPSEIQALACALADVLTGAGQAADLVRDELLRLHRIGLIEPLR